MVLDLIDIKKEKMSKRKLIIYSLIITLILVVLFTILIIKLINESNIQKEKQDRLYSISRIKHKVIINYDYTLSEEGKKNIKNVYKSEQKRVFLTFDDGPSKTVTPLILDFLKQENIRATFFVLGSRVEFYPQIIKRAYDEGHFIANHGYSHVYNSIYSSPQAVLDEYNTTENAIKNALQMPEYKSNVFRFPGGFPGGKYRYIKQDAANLLEQEGVTYLDWNALSGDSEGIKTKEELMQKTIETMGNKNSVVILMHDAGDKILTYEMLLELIPYLRENGYEFQNMYDLLKTNIQTQ